MANFDLKALGLELGAPKQEGAKPSILIYSQPGAGKTTFCGTVADVPELCPALLIDVERGTLSIANKDYGDKLTIVHVKTYDDVIKLFAMISANEDMPFKTVIIDPVDRLQELILKAYDNPGNPYAKWEAVFEKLMDIIVYSHKTCGLTVICTTHAALEKDEVSGRVLIAPDFEGKKSYRKLPQVFDIIGFLTQEKDKASGETYRMLNTSPLENIVSKSRIPTLPGKLGNPTMGKVMGYVNEFVNPTPKPAQNKPAVKLAQRSNNNE